MKFLESSTFFYELEKDIITRTINKYKEAEKL